VQKPPAPNSITLKMDAVPFSEILKKNTLQGAKTDRDDHHYENNFALHYEVLAKNVKAPSAL
jgi:hypothetical protein